MKLDFEIIDFHTHPFTDEENNICSHKQFCDMSPDHIRRDMEAVGVSKICGSVINSSGRTPGDYSQWDYIEMCNRGMLEMEQRLGDYYVPGMMVHPDYVAKSCDCIEKLYAHGVRLVGELVPYCHGWKDYSCKGFSQILDCITEKNMIVSIHSMGEDEMDRMVEAHPDTKIVFAHPGEAREVQRHIARMQKSKNAYLDLSGTGLFRHGMLREIIDRVGVERVIFGSDYPTCNPAMFVGGVLFDPLITEQEKKMIFAENIRNLFASVGKII